uniref:Uncharacterized protein n=1 Tax=Globisporangium ultimum (strain ATCC 200006 / CBS 805.95 / DAOM BR144) TaxID=431595 RepID=K3WWQ1_GLOUD
MVDQILGQARSESMNMHDTLSEDYEAHKRAFGRVQLEEELDRLTKFVRSWNDSKRVKFTDGKLLGRAIVRVSTTQSFASTSMIISRTSIRVLPGQEKKNKVKELFKFKSKEYDSIKDSSVHKLRGACAGTAEFHVSHHVTVTEKGGYQQAHELKSPKTEVTFRYKRINSSSLERRMGWTWSGGGSVGHRPGAQGSVEGGASTNVSVHGSEAITRSWQEISGISFSTSSYLCDIGMTIVNKSYAYHWAHAAAGIFTFGILEVANYDKDYKKELTTRFTFEVPIQYVESAWVTNSATDLLNSLMGNPIVSILCRRRGLRVIEHDGERILTNVFQNDGDEYKVGIFGAAFLIHVCPDHRFFYLSSMKQTTNDNGDDSAVEWVRIDVDGRLALAKTPEQFQLHRDSKRHKHWVLQAMSSNKFVSPDAELIFTRIFCAHR